MSNPILDDLLSKDTMAYTNAAIESDTLNMTKNNEQYDRYVDSVQLDSISTDTSNSCSIDITNADQTGSNSISIDGAATSDAGQFFYRSDESFFDYAANPGPKG